MSEKILLGFHPTTRTPKTWGWPAAGVCRYGHLLLLQVTSSFLLPLNGTFPALIHVLLVLERTWISQHVVAPFYLNTLFLEWAD